MELRVDCCSYLRVQYLGSRGRGIRNSKLSSITYEVEGWPGLCETLTPQKNPTERFNGTHFSFHIRVPPNTHCRCIAWVSVGKPTCIFLSTPLITPDSPDQLTSLDYQALWTFLLVNCSYSLGVSVYETLSLMFIHHGGGGLSTQELVNTQQVLYMELSTPAL